jgi:hypothetical protein
MIFFFPPMYLVLILDLDFVLEPHRESVWTNRGVWNNNNKEQTKIKATNNNVCIRE